MVNTKKSFKGFTDGERTAMQSRIKELNADKKADGENAALDAIAKMPGVYRAMGERIHTIIKETAPELLPKTWYGLPSYAKDGKVICYMRMNPKLPFNDRYLTFGFNEAAHLDTDTMWPTAFALVKLTDVEEKKIIALVKQAVK